MQSISDNASQTYPEGNTVTVPDGTTTVAVAEALPDLAEEEDAAALLT